MVKYELFINDTWIYKLRGFKKNVYLLVVHGKMLLETNGVTKRIPLHQINHIQTD